ncbi:MAG: SGNH/GDSL hydrolase family protein [Magnetospirillum sp.]|nr:MAG: SGNH/GDSL hydrolase family protein [Magnetospirillum sp.]
MAAEPAVSGGGRPRRTVVIAAALVVVVGLLAVAEGMARLVQVLDSVESPALAALLNRDLSLNPYQQASARFPHHWELRPGWGADVQELLEIKRVHGRMEGASVIKAVVAAGYSQPFKINPDGFKGPPLDPDRRLPRVVGIGDSVTFGLGGWDWLQALAARLASRGTPVEVVNGGVEGYALINARFQAPHYLTAHADICVIMMGWNDLWNEDPLYGTPWAHLKLIPVARRLAHRLGGLVQDSDARTQAEELRSRPMVPRRDDPMLARFGRYRPAGLADAEALGDTLAAGGCKMALATLTGLYRSDRQPSPGALAIGHLPAFTDNPYVLAAMADGLNQGLRELAKRKGWPLIDLEAWGREVLEPRDQWFSDSVHMRGKALAEVGFHIADEIAPMLANGSPSR